MIIATAGHVDHGKTSLIKALTGTDTDKLPEEKKRGLTIEAGFAYYHCDNIALGFIDVPGHHRFIGNMLAGIAAIDFALLVIAADDGPMPQTAEHLAALYLTGVTRAAIVITKVDRVSDAQLVDVKQRIDLLLADTPLAQSPHFHVSSLHGDGVGPLLNHIVQQARLLPDRDSQGNFRLAVDRRFIVDGTGLIVTGTVHSGSATVGDELVISPGGQRVRIRSMHQDNRPTTSSCVGHRCAINLGGQGLGINSVKPGSWLVHPSAHHSSKRLDASFHLLNSESKPLQHWTPVHIHTGASHLTGRIAVLTDNKVISPGHQGDVQIVVETPIPVLWNDKFIVRDQSATRIIGGGHIIDPNAPARNRTKAWRQRDRGAHRLTNASDAMMQLAHNHPEGYSVTSFLQGRNYHDQHQSDIIKQLPKGLVLIDKGNQKFIIPRSRWQQVGDELLNVLLLLHRNTPTLLGSSPETLSQALSEPVLKPVFASVVTDLRQRGKLKHSGQVLHLPDHNPSVSVQDKKFLMQFLALLPEDQLCPPVAHEIAKKMGLDPVELIAKLDYLSSMGQLVGIQQQRYFLPKSLQDIAQQLERLAETASDKGFTAADFKNTTGIGRRPSVQLLEFFDRAGLTRRNGNYRFLVGTPTEVFGDIAEQSPAL